MNNITIPVSIPSDLFIALNESKDELSLHFQVAIAIRLFQEGKLTIGKAAQVSGLSRIDFEKMLAKNKIPVSQLNMDDILSDLDKMKEL